MKEVVCISSHRKFYQEFTLIDIFQNNVKTLESSLFTRVPCVNIQRVNFLRRYRPLAVRKPHSAKLTTNIKVGFEFY